jgi:hypothetical protein
VFEITNLISSKNKVVWANAMPIDLKSWTKVDPLVCVTKLSKTIRDANRVTPIARVESALGTCA